MIALNLKPYRECPFYQEALRELAYDLLSSSWLGLGILVARGVIPAASGLDAEFLLGDLLKTRDRLQLSPNDPVEEIYEMVFLEKPDDEADGSEALVQARRRLEEKKGEVQSLKRELETLRLKLQERPALKEARAPQVAIAVLRLIGRLSAGDPDAFNGARRLQAHAEVFRQRVGLSHRLLFRLQKDILEIVALIHRRDLEKTIKLL